MLRTGPNKKTRFIPFYSRRETESPAPRAPMPNDIFATVSGSASGKWYLTMLTAATTNAFGTAIDNGYYRHLQWNQPELTTLGPGSPFGVCRYAAGAR